MTCYVCQVCKDLQRVCPQGDPEWSEEMKGGAIVGIFCTYFHTVSFLLNLPLRFSS